MKNKNADVIKILAEINDSFPELTKDEEALLEKALDPELQFLETVEKLFKTK